MSLAELRQSYEQRKSAIRARLKDFESIKNDKLFAELCFCICTPQSKARTCDAAIQKLGSRIKSDNSDAIARDLTGVRFANNKARYIVEARQCYDKLAAIVAQDNKKAREWLVQNVKGLGYKEASHFLRNVGQGHDIAILDRHILKNLVKHSVISEIPKTITPKRYLAIEDSMRSFSEHTGIPMNELDLLFWSSETGEIFK